MNSPLNYTLASKSKTAWSLVAGARGAFAAAIFLTDIFVIIATSLMTGVTYHLIIHDETGDIFSFLNVGTSAAAIFVASSMLIGEYRVSNLLSHSAHPHSRRLWFRWNVTCAALLVLAFVSKTTVVYSRGWFLVFYACTFFVVAVTRYLWVKVGARASQSGEVLAKRTFLIGTGRQIAEFIRRYEPWRFGANIVGCRFLTPMPKEASEAMRQQVLHQDLEEAVESARQLDPESIYILLPWSDTSLIHRCAETFLALPVEIHLGPERILERFPNSQLSTLGRICSLQLTRLPLSRFEILEKRLFDLVVSALALALLTPLLILVMILIRVSSAGPVLFLQRRYGFNQQEFRIVKFRTMTTLDDGEIIRQAIPNDPRVTRVGRWLRRWNIDEIPQLFNVLLGDMSLVGPRPHALSHNHEYERKISLYARRHNVKPGITGWAQIHGYRGETSSDEQMRRRVEHDLYYIDHWSVWLDVRILTQTVLSPKAYKNAR
jgi:Undecaprenyl-phosphate glucose phosphotransferase